MLERTMANCYPGISATDAFTKGLARLADGDVRQSLNLLELSIQVASANGNDVNLDESLLADLMETACAASIRVAISSMNRSVRCTNRCEDPTQMLPSIGLHG